MKKGKKKNSDKKVNLKVTVILLSNLVNDFIKGASSHTVCLSPFQMIYSIIEEAGIY